MINQDVCNKALIFASIKHEGQKMKQPMVGYVAHLQGVCLEALSGCLNDGINVDLEKVIVLALLHDTMEDTGVLYNELEERFGKDIADGVEALTKNYSLIKEDRMKDSLNRIKKQGIEVSIVKMADRIFNLKDVPCEWDEERINEYREESILILNELGEVNKYMANRLKEKIEKYNK